MNSLFTRAFLAFLAVQRTFLATAAWDEGRSRLLASFELDKGSLGHAVVVSNLAACSDSASISVAYST